MVLLQRFYLTICSTLPFVRRRPVFLPVSELLGVLRYA